MHKQNKLSLCHSFDDQVVGLCIWLHLRLAMAALVVLIEILEMVVS